MRYENEQLTCELRDLPAPAPSADFEQRVLTNALESTGPRIGLGRLGMGVSAASGVLIAVLVAAAFQSTIQSTDRDRSAEQTAVVPSETTDTRSPTRSVNVRLASTRAIDNALLTVELADNLILESHPELRRMSWHTNLKPGNNRLTLPVRQLDERGGEIIVTLQHGDHNQQLAIHINGV